jgi:signal transduction histidine kinase
VNEQLQRVNANLEKLVEDRTEELKLTIEKLVETDNGLDTFLYRSSHDLRGPITSLLGLASVAKIQNQQDELDPYFSSMEDTAGRMLRLLKRLNDTGTLFRAKRKTEIINVERFVQSILTQLSNQHTTNHVRIEIENNVGEFIASDPILLNHIIVNLMENGVVFREEHTPFVKCSLYLENDLVIQVTDNGIGISPEVRNRIFDMFYRGSERSVGNGLGLFMVKKTLEILEGSIHIDSEPGKLTTFIVRIPLNGEQTS